MRDEGSSLDKSSRENSGRRTTRVAGLARAQTADLE